MSRFDDGVKAYIKGYCTVEVLFPIDWRDNPDIRCDQCKYYGRTSKMCQLNKQIVEYPDKFRGGHCPLIIEGEIIDE